MDRPLDSGTVNTKKRKRFVQVGLVLAGIIAIYFILSAWITPSLSRSEIRTAFVEQGNIEGSISATGTVIPKFEQTIASPGETRLIAVKKRPGEFVKKGESILDLDRSGLTLLLDRTEKDLSLKANQRKQLQLDMEKTLTGLTAQLKIKDLQLQYNESKTKQSIRLFELGAVSKEQLDQVKLDEQIARIEREDLDTTVTNTKQSLQNQLDGITTEFQTLRKEKNDVARQLDLLACKAGQDGVVTWVNDVIGSSIKSGDVIARVADLSSYMVEANVSDIHAAQLSVGMIARIHANDLTISGKILTVYPTIENGIARIALTLDDAANKSLRPNLRVDVYLVTNKHDSTMKIKKGPFVNGDGEQFVYVVRDGVARKTPVTIGLVNFDEVEIASGVSPGDEIIISDMNDYKHLSQLKIH